jgi:amino acid transporter
MNSEKHPELCRVMGVRMLSANVVNMIVGAGIYALPSAVGAKVGAAAPMAFALCALAIGLVMICFAMAGSRVEATGGVYAYVGAAFGPLAGFQAGVLLCLASALTSAAIANAFIGALGNFIPALMHGWGRLAALVALYSSVALINVLGVKQGARLVETVTTAKLIPLVVFVCVGAFYIHAANVSWPGMPNHHALGQAILTLMFAFMGAEAALTTSGEVRNPSRTVPLSLLCGISVVAVLYMSIQLVAQGVLGPELASAKDNPLVQAAARFPEGGVSLMTVGFTLSSLGLISGDMLATPRSLYAFAQDRLLPPSLGRLHSRFRTPYPAIILYAALILGAAASSRFQALADRVVVMLLFLYLLTCAAAWRLEQRDFRAARGQPLTFPGAKWVPVAAIGVVIWLLTTAAKEDLALAMGVMLATLVLYLVTRSERQQRAPQHEPSPDAAR